MATGIKREQIIMALVIVGVLAALPLALNPRLRCTVTGGDWVEPAKASRPTFPAPLPPGLSPTEALEELQDRERAFQEYQRQPDFCDY